MTPKKRFKNVNIMKAQKYGLKGDPWSYKTNFMPK